MWGVHGLIGLMNTWMNKFWNARKLHKLINKLALFCFTFHILSSLSNYFFSVAYASHRKICASASTDEKSRGRKWHIEDVWGWNVIQCSSCHFWFQCFKGQCVYVRPVLHVCFKAICWLNFYCVQHLDILSEKI